ncbi:MAG: hypothetical protein L3I91_01855 [Mycoplasma sp.]
MSEIEIVGAVLIALAGITSIFILIPQLINLHRNKYSDNSNIGLYWVYLWSNVIWTTYQIIFNIDFIKTPKNVGSPQIPLLFVQLAIDIISLIVGIYSLGLKYYYSGKRKFVNQREEEIISFKQKITPELIKVLETLDIKVLAKDKENLVTLANSLCVYARTTQDLIEQKTINDFVSKVFNENKEQLFGSIQANIDHKLIKKYIRDNNTGLNKIAYAMVHADHLQKAIWLSRTINHYLFLAS